jgi:RNase P subunit RPR2
MFISRSLNIHICHKCKEKLIDRNFSQCGITLNSKDTKNKWTTFFDYTCPSCRYKGRWQINLAQDEMPGDIFRQLGSAIDEDYIKNQHREEVQGLEDFLDEIKEDNDPVGPE